jgi:MFS family permease
MLRYRLHHQLWWLHDDPCLLGLFEGGMMPGITYYLSTWYRRHELALRIGIFVSAASLSGAFGGLLATAFLSIPQIKGLYALLY